MLAWVGDAMDQLLESVSFFTGLRGEYEATDRLVVRITAR